jgi:hypothetical protein
MFIKIFSAGKDNYLEHIINKFLESYKNIWEKDCKIISIQYSSNISSDVTHDYNRDYENENINTLYSCAIMFEGNEKINKSEEGMELYYAVYKHPDGEAKYIHAEIYAPSLNSAKYQWDNGAESKGTRDIDYINRGHSWNVIRAKEYNEMVKKEIIK